MASRIPPSFDFLCVKLSVILLGMDLNRLEVPMLEEKGAKGLSWDSHAVAYMHVYAHTHTLICHAIISQDTASLAAVEF